MTSLLSRLLPRNDSSAKSGQVTEALLRGRVGDYLSEEEVSNERLLTLFKQAFIQVECGDGPYLRVTSENGVRLSVSVDKERRLISLAATFGLREEAALHEKLVLCNRVNDSVIFVRLSLSSRTTLCADHQLPFDGGITAAAIVAATRRLARITVQAIQEMDTDRVVS